MRFAIWLCVATLPALAAAGPQKKPPKVASKKEPPPRWQTLPLPPAMPRAAETGFVDIADGTKIYFARYGKGAPVILLHGGMGNADHWSNQVPALADKFHVIAIDSRGQGRSTRPKNLKTKPSYDVMATDVLSVMDHLKLEKASIVGWSDGGEIGLKLGIHHAKRVDKLVVFGANYDAKGTKARTGKSSTFAIYSAKCRADYAKLSKTPKQYDAVVQWLVPIWRNPMGFTPDQLKGITAPTLIADGKHDEIIRLDQIEEMAELIPKAKLHVFEEASHFALWQDPEAFNKVVVEFLTLPSP